jgi:glycosyltransferase involved in cell wall biosynthesis
VGQHPVRIVRIISGLDQGGAEESLRKLLSASGSASGQSLVVSLRAGGQVRAEIEALGVPVIDLGLTRLPTPRALHRLHALVAECRPQIIEGWMTHGNLAATLAKRAAPHAALVWNVRSLLLTRATASPLTRALLRLSRTMAGRADAIVYNSERSAAEHAHFGYPASRGAVIPNGFDLERFRPSPSDASALRARYRIAPRVPVIGHVSRWHPHKDQRTLLAAFSELCKRRPDAVLVLAGEGLSADNEALASLMAELGIEQSVRLLGPMRPVHQLYSMFDLFVLSSITEAFPNVLGEAMASGVVCIATDVGECRRLIGTDERIVEPGNVSRLAACMVRELGRCSQERLADAHSGRRRIAEQFSLAAAAAAYESLYASILHQP